MVPFVIVALLVLIDTSSAILHSVLWPRNDSLANKVFADPLFNSTEKSRVKCAMRCSENHCCRAMTFNAGTLVCNGYSSVGNAFITDTGSECYHQETPSAFYRYDEGVDICFSLKTDLQTHGDAYTQCQQENGALMKIDTVERLMAAKFVLLSYYNGASASIWVDGFDYSSSNTYTMANGASIPLTSSLWVPDEPNNALERCVGLYDDFMLNDFDCYRSLPYLCEY